MKPRFSQLNRRSRSCLRTWRPWATPLSPAPIRKYHQQAACTKQTGSYGEQHFLGQFVLEMKAGLDLDSEFQHVNSSKSKQNGPRDCYIQPLRWIHKFFSSTLGINESELDLEGAKGIVRRSIEMHNRNFE